MRQGEYKRIWGYLIMIGFFKPFYFSTEEVKSCTNIKNNTQPQQICVYKWMNY